MRFFEDRAIFSGSQDFYWGFRDFFGGISRGEVRLLSSRRLGGHQVGFQEKKAAREDQLGLSWRANE